ncbi:MAG TPA: asparagine synthase (glutamine-hydrolyzing) [Chitinophagaceae bacterium]|nr:asparagine synthase (glutamine-hydrolyzing) [Chitinophagaceae bacterium]
MCGITGILSFSETGSRQLLKVEAANGKMLKRGPDGGNFSIQESAALGHRRLSIIDTSDNASQPMSDPSGRYTITFNGEIFNYQELREKYFPDKGDWHSHSDTEVLLHLFIKLKENCLSLLSGFFAFAIYDKQKQELFLARDRFGKKPIHYFRDENYFAFASELKALMAYDIPKKLNYTSLVQYLQLNYIPQPFSILEGVRKLEAGHYLLISQNTFEIKPYYELKWTYTNRSIGFDEACSKLEVLMDDSVRKRLISDVPLGAFLSGGIDSSVVVALASQHTKHLNTFSIGYADNVFFDETYYANLVAKRYQTNHTVFSLSNHHFLEHINDILSYIDEPFADSSAIPEFILSFYTRKHVTVALSGDGGDEVFAGYNKHAAELRIREKSFLNSLVTAGQPIWKSLPQSRNKKSTNFFRQLNRFAEGAKLDVKERYWRWAGFLTEQQAWNLLTPGSQTKIDSNAFGNQKRNLLQYLKDGDSLEDLLATDIGLVLLSDMLVKVDLMSMANSLEVRSPFLDHEVVDFAFSLPTCYKIDKNMKKKIVQDTFRKYLPAELYNRPKHGFEIPLLDWFKKELRAMITDDLLNDKFVAEQGIFDARSVHQLKAKLFSNNPGDAHATVWALIVFQSWWRNYFN